MSSRRLFIKQIGLGTLSLGLASSLPTNVFSQTPAQRALPRSTPEEQGVSSEGISTFLDAVAKSNVAFHSIMIVRNGYVIAEGWWAPYAPDLKHTLYSLSKSFTSSAVGFAVAEGKLTVEDKVVSFFPDDLPAAVSTNLAAMRVKDLLTMSTGHAQDTITPIRNSPDKSWAKTFLEQPVEFEPGTHFLYNTGATFMLSAIVQKLTGQTVQRYLRPRLFDPLGIEGEDWETNFQGINVGGYGLRVKTEDIAKFGLLYLQNGKWNGTQLLPEKWIEDATIKEVKSNPSNPAQDNSDSDWSQGYGYQFWRCKPGGFRADGAFGQFSIVNPDKNTVIAVTSESFDMQTSMRLIWNNILPAIKENALAPNNGSQKILTDQLKKLSLPLAEGKTSPEIKKLIDRIQGKEFVLEANDFNIKSIAFRFNSADVSMHVNGTDKSFSMPFLYKGWNRVSTSNPIPFPLPGSANVPSKIATNACWQDDKTLLLTLRLIETAHGDLFTCHFDENNVTLKFLNSISRGNPKNPEKRADLRGKLA